MPENRYLIPALFFVAAFVAGCGLTWILMTRTPPASLSECILQNAPGAHTESAMQAIYTACEALSPKPRLDTSGLKPLK